MHLQFLKNIQFTRLAKATDRLREFNFRKVSRSGEDAFHVDVSDDRGNRIIFYMQKDNTNWKITTTNQGLPQWVYAAEDKLHELIVEETN